MKTLIINIKQLVQVEEEPRKWVAGADMAKLGIIDDAYLLINEDKIEAFGKMSELNQGHGHGEGNRCQRTFGSPRLL